MARYEFQSIFKEEIHRYVEDKSSAGYKAENIRRNLINFDKFCAEEKLSSLYFTKETAERWIKQRDVEGPTTHYSRVNQGKNFLKYLQLKGYDVYVPRDVRFIGTDFEPHIYTASETEKYFYAVDHHSSCRNKKDAIQYPVLFRILYCCGTRINETLGIRKKDVDLDKGIILLNETKNNKQRYVVMGDDLCDLMKTFADKCFYQLGEEDFIFTNSNGGRLNQDQIYNSHREFLHQAGIPFLGDGKGPRIHDWRHHMAVYSFKQLADSGMDMYVALPILSTYLGHKTILATERYVRLTMQIFPYIEEKFRPTVDKIFDAMTKVGDFDETD